MKVQSLKHTIIAQFTVILLPVVALLVYQTLQNAQRTSELSVLSARHSLAVAAKERYAVFNAGVTDAAETSVLAAPALAALWDARHALHALGEGSHTPDLVETAARVFVMAQQLETSPAVANLHAYRDHMAEIRRVIHAIEAEQDLNSMV